MIAEILVTKVHLNNGEGIEIVVYLLFIPLYVVFIWQFFNPKKALLRGHVNLLRIYYYPKAEIKRRSRHNSREGVDVSENEITQAKVSAIAGVLFVTLVIIISQLALHT